MWLKVDQRTIHDALSKNRRTTDVGSRKGRDITQTCLRLFEEGQEFSIDPKGRTSVPSVPGSLAFNPLDFQYDTLIFDRDEFRQYVRDFDAMGEDSRRRHEEEQAEAHRSQQEAKHWTEEQKAEYSKSRREEAQKRVERGWLNQDERIRKYTLRAIFESAPAAKQGSDLAGSAGRGDD